MTKNKRNKTKFALPKKPLDSIRQNFWFATLNFIFIVCFIQLFQMLFGVKNGIVAVILSVLMGIYAGKDVSIAPVKKFFIHTLVLSALSVAACLSRSLGPFVAIAINLPVTFCVLYAYTYEYSGHLYFPYILSYLFLLFISPVEIAELPLRLGSIAAGTFCMMFYALLLKNRNIERPAQNSIASLISLCRASAQRPPIDKQNEESENLLCEKAREEIYRLSKNAEMRKSGAAQYYDGAFRYLEAGCALENLLLFLTAAPFTSEQRESCFPALLRALKDMENFARKRTGYVPMIQRDEFSFCELSRTLYDLICAARETVTKAFQKKRQKRRKAKPPLEVRLRSFLDYSPTKLFYALRVSLLLTVCLFPVQYLSLFYGKWLLFTLASVSLPYADDVRKKGQKRLGATLMGGAVAVVLFSIVPDAGARTAIMMLSGYLSFYFKDYLGNFACATVGALGGAVAFTLTGWANVSAVFAVRLFYVALGILIAYGANLLILPYRRKRASETIYRNYIAACKALCERGLDRAKASEIFPLVIRNNLLEEKLLINAESAKKREITLSVVRVIRKAMAITFQKNRIDPAISEMLEVR